MGRPFTRVLEIKGGIPPFRASKPRAAHNMDAFVVALPHEILYRRHGAADDPPNCPRDSIKAVVPCCLSPPAPASCAVIENVCGAFLAYYDPAPHRAVQNRPTCLFGRPREMYHIEGNVYVHRNKAHFRACRGIACIRRLAAALRLPDPACVVHMCVFRLALGRRLHTGHGCYLETQLQRRFRSLRVCCRLMDMNSLIKLRIDRFDRGDIPFFDAGQPPPSSIDVTVSGQGIVIARVSSRACRWDADREALHLRFCDWLGQQLAECC